MSNLLPYEEIEYPQLQNDDSHEASDRNRHFPTYALPVINHSPGGYCLAWPGAVPAELQAGEMVGIEDTCRSGLEHRGGALDPSGARRWYANGHRTGGAVRRALRSATGA